MVSVLRPRFCSGINCIHLESMTYFLTLGKEVFVLDSATITHEPLDKRTVVYSYALSFTMINEVIRLSA